jgi:hypothetical protein
VNGSQPGNKVVEEIVHDGSRDPNLWHYWHPARLETTLCGIRAEWEASPGWERGSGGKAVCVVCAAMLP